MLFNVEAFLKRLLFLCIEGMIITYIWNGLIPTIHFPELSYGQGIGILFGLRLLLRPLWNRDTESLDALKRIENLLLFQIQIESVKYTAKAALATLGAKAVTPNELADKSSE